MPRTIIQERIQGLLKAYCIKNRRIRPIEIIKKNPKIYSIKYQSRLNEIKLLLAYGHKATCYSAAIKFYFWSVFQERKFFNIVSLFKTSAKRN